MHANDHATREDLDTDSVGRFYESDLLEILIPDEPVYSEEDGVWD